MTYILYSFLCLLLIIIQTVILPEIPGTQGAYDVLMIFVFYLGLFRPTREGIPIILILGFIMDNLSGAPFGLYLTTYFWIFVGVKWITAFLRVRNIVLLPMLIASGILVKNFLFIGTIALSVNRPELNIDVLSRIVYQLLWAVITGPVLLILFNRIHYKWDIWTLDLFAERNGQKEP